MGARQLRFFGLRHRSRAASESRRETNGSRGRRCRPDRILRGSAHYEWVTLALRRRYPVAATALLAVMFFFRGRGRYRYRGRFLPFYIRPVPRKLHTLAGCSIHVQFLVAKRHPDLLFDPDTDADPDPDFIRFPLSFSFRQH
jgi:hypothetical protein